MCSIRAEVEMNVLLAVLLCMSARARLHVHVWVPACVSLVSHRFAYLPIMTENMTSRRKVGFTHSPKQTDARTTTLAGPCANLADTAHCEERRLSQHGEAACNTFALLKSPSTAVEPFLCTTDYFRPAMERGKVVRNMPSALLSLVQGTLKTSRP